MQTVWVNVLIRQQVFRSKVNMNEAESKQLKIARKNIARLIVRINLLEDYLEKHGKPATLRPQYQVDIIDDNGVAIA